MSRPLIKVEYDVASFNSLRNLANKVDQYPNRIQAARVAGTISAARKIEAFLAKKYGNIGRAMYIEDSVSGKTSRLVLRVNKPKGSRRNHHYSAEWGAMIKLYGRKGFSSKSGLSAGGNTRYYLVRPASGDPEFITRFKVRPTPKNAGMVLDIKMEMSRITRKELIAAIRRQGFGARGGAPRGMTDSPAPTTRAKRS